LIVGSSLEKPKGRFIAMSHYPDSYSSTNLAPSQAGVKTGVGGSAASPGIPPELIPTDKPPLTNRGAPITFPLINQFLIDWAAFTFKLDDPQEVVKIIGLNPSLFSDLDYGFSGYRKSLRYGQISVYYEGRENMGCHVCMSGQGCRQYEGQFQESPWLTLFNNALSNKAKFTRLDLAHDNVDGVLDLDKLKSAIVNREIRTRFKKATETQNFDLSPDIDQPDDGHTIYFGKRSSRVYMRFYDKAGQLGLSLPWNRAEVELKEKRAHEAVKLIASGCPVGGLFVGIVNQYLTVINLDDSNKSRCAVQGWWSAWLQSTEKIKLATAKQTKYVDEVMEYVKRQYAPSIAMIKTHVGTVRFNDYIQELLKDGMVRMSMRHEQMLFVSSQGSSDSYGEEFEERAAIMEYDGGMGKTEAEEAARLSLDQENQP
jgi:phage replication initiation protein